jgi:hypothetical protein
MAHFDESGLTFDYPSAWHVSHPAHQGRTRLVATLSTIDPTTASTACDDSIGYCYQVEPNSLVVSISAGTLDAFSIDDSPPGALRVSVGGLPAYMQTAVSADGGARMLIWTLSYPGAPHSFYRVAGSIHTPDREFFEPSLRTMIESIRYGTGVPPP